MSICCVAARRQGPGSVLHRWAKVEREGATLGSPLTCRGARRRGEAGDRRDECTSDRPDGESLRGEGEEKKRVRGERRWREERGERREEGGGRGPYLALRGR